MGKKKDNTGFRNGDLFCFNCGQAYKMNLPQPVDMATAIMKQFSKSHKDCPPTWIEPVNEGNTKTELENCSWWLINGEHGISSKTMFKYLDDNNLPVQIQSECHPLDPDDFRRCYLLLKAVPQFKDKLYRLKTISKTWSNLVDNWDRLTEMLEEQMRTKSKNGMYDFMDSLGC